MRCRWTRPAPAAANLDDLRVTWFWPGNSLEGNRQLRPYIAASARCAGRRPGERGSDELRAPDLRTMRRAGGGRPLSGVPGSAGPRSPSLRRQPAADHRRHPGADLRAPAGLALRALEGSAGPGDDPPRPRVWGRPQTPRSFLTAALAHPADLSVDEFVDLAVQDRQGVPGLHASAHVLDVLVRVEDVVADLGPPGAAAVAPQRLHLLRVLLPPPFEQLGLEDGHGRGPVLDLTALVLAGNHDHGGHVGDPDGGVRGVDPLAAGPARAEHVDPDLVVVD